MQSVEDGLAAETQHQERKSTKRTDEVPKTNLKKKKSLRNIAWPRPESNGFSL
jgi:hypothetical protein